jgi:putative restriction endonuclease
VNQTAFFERLGAPLKNARWSWGAVRPDDGTVFLKVWRDQMRTHNGTLFAQITYRARFRDNPDNFRHRAREEQVKQIRAGSSCYLIECVAADPTARPRRVQWFNAAEVFPGGRVVELDGEVWVEMLPAVPVAEVVPGARR